MSSNLLFCYFANLMHFNSEEEYAKYVYPTVPYTALTKHTLEVIERNFNASFKDKNNFLNKFLRFVNKEDYYFFITSKPQTPNMEYIINKNELAKYVHYRSKEVPNYNHSKTEPRLTVFIFKFDEEGVNKWKQ